MDVLDAPPDAAGLTAPDRVAGDVSEGRALSPLLWRLLVIGAVVAVAGSIVLRFVARSDMWLDEALTLNISKLPIGQIHGALRRDGAPPLYYYLLHFWMEAFGTSDGAVRALSGVFSCATLPFIWLAGRRLGGRTVATGALVLVATSPFAVRYATENRMYALVGLLTAAGLVAMQQVLARRTAANVIAVGVVTALLLYTHYWALYVVGVTMLWLAFQAWRGAALRRPGARAALVAMAVGCLSFLPWLSTFIYQSRHTGTPWAKPADFAAMINAVTSFSGGDTNQGRALALVYFALAGLGLFGVARGAFYVELDLRTRPRSRALAVAAGRHTRRRHRGGVRQPERLPGPLRLGGVRAAGPARGARPHHLRRSSDAGRGDGGHGGLRARRRHPQRLDESHPGGRGRHHARQPSGARATSWPSARTRSGPR